MCLYNQSHLDDFLILSNIKAAKPKAQLKASIWQLFPTAYILILNKNLHFPSKNNKFYSPFKFTTITSGTLLNLGSF